MRSADTSQPVAAVEHRPLVVVVAVHTVVDTLRLAVVVHIAVAVDTWRLAVAVHTVVVVVTLLVEQPPY